MKNSISNLFANKYSLSRIFGSYVLLFSFVLSVMVMPMPVAAEEDEHSEFHEDEHQYYEHESSEEDHSSEQEETHHENHEDGKGTIVVHKTLIKDNGSNGDLNGFSFTLEQLSGNIGTLVGTFWFNLSGEASVEVVPGNYRIIETAATSRGYTTSYQGCGPNTPVTVSLYGTAPCSITNNDIAPRLVLKNIVVGGSASLDDWILSATGPKILTGHDGVTSDGTFMVGSYTLSASGPAGYTTTWSCDLTDTDGKTAFDGSSIFLEEGDDLVCTATETASSSEGEGVPTDVCANLDGVQTTVPEGLVLSGGNQCLPGNGGGDTGTTTEGTSTPPVTDVCANIDGTQTSVPEGLVLLGEDQCVVSGVGGGDDTGTTTPDGSSSTTHHSHHSSKKGSGQVLGACAPLLTNYLGRNFANAPEDVKKLQGFLNEQMESTLTVDGIFNPMTEKEVHTFQKKYWEDVLVPWFPIPDSGIATKEESTGIVYKTTLHKINDLFCGTQTPLPELP